MSQLKLIAKNMRQVSKIFLFLTVAISILIKGCNSQSINNNRQQQQVTVLGSITGAQQKKLQQALAPFTKETGIEIVYEGTHAFTTLLPIRVDSGNPPDLAIFPQPGLMADLAREGKLIPLEQVLDTNKLQRAYAPDWLNLATIDDKMYGVWYRVSVKSLVWYSPKAFQAAGYRIPQTWQEMLALSDQIVADGKVPWCLGLESGDSTGWVGSDWIEDIMLRTAGAKVYDRWISHQIPFNDSRVKTAFQEFGKIARNDKYVLGGKVGVISTPFGDSPAPLFDRPPGCYLHRQANFITSFLPSSVKLGEDVGIFPLPPIKPELGNPVLVAGDMLAMFKDTPEARKLIEYSTTKTPHEIWAGLGGFISPHKQVSLDAYPDSITRAQVQILQDAEVVRFDASDMMPGAVGTGTFWTGVVDYVGGTPLDTVLEDIENSWPQE